MKKSPRAGQCTYKLQSNPGDHWARAEREGDDAGYNDEAVKRYRQVYVFRSWKKEESKSSLVWKTSQHWLQGVRLRKKTHMRRLLSSLCTRWCQHHPPGQPLSCRCARCCWRWSLNRTVLSYERKGLRLNSWTFTHPAMKATCCRVK